MVSSGPASRGLPVAIWVKPGGRTVAVGGQYRDALVVRVQARAVDGKASEAALHAVADAFSVPRARVRLIRGAATRSKMVEVGGDRVELARVLRALLARTV